jgi:hypothetical protein
MSVLFGAMVLGVFWRSYDKGPISTIKRFHEAVRKQDPVLLQRSIDFDSDPTALQFLVSQTRALLAQNAVVEVAGIDGAKNEVRAAVVYQIEHQAPMLKVWVIDRQRDSWRVNPYRTVSLMDQLVNRSR